MRTGCAICIWKILPPFTPTEEEDERRELERLQRFIDDLQAEDTSTIESDGASASTVETSHPEPIPTYVSTEDRRGEDFRVVYHGADGGADGRSDDDNGSGSRHDAAHDSNSEEESRSQS